MKREEMISELIYQAQNDEMIDTHYTDSGKIMNEAARMLQNLPDLTPMEWARVIKSLCWHDVRNPDYIEDSRSSTCSCDNCFYGKDGLARMCLRLGGKS